MFGQRCISVHVCALKKEEKKSLRILVQICNMFKYN